MPKNRKQTYSDRQSLAAKAAKKTPTNQPPKKKSRDDSK